jgi:hypothetical protein
MRVILTDAGRLMSLRTTIRLTGYVPLCVAPNHLRAAVTLLDRRDPWQLTRLLPASSCCLHPASRSPWCPYRRAARCSANPSSVQPARVAGLTGSSTKEHNLCWRPRRLSSDSATLTHGIVTYFSCELLSIQGPSAAHSATIPPASSCEPLQHMKHHEACQQLHGSGVPRVLHPFLHDIQGLTYTTALDINSAGWGACKHVNLPQPVHGGLFCLLKSVTIKLAITHLAGVPPCVDMLTAVRVEGSCWDVSCDQRPAVQSPWYHQRRAARCSANPSSVKKR